MIHLSIFGELMEGEENDVEMADEAPPTKEQNRSARNRGREEPSKKKVKFGAEDDEHDLNNDEDFQGGSGGQV